MVGALVGVIATAAGVYQVVEDMAGDALDEGKKAIGNIDRKIKKIAKKQKEMIDKAVSLLDDKLQKIAEKQSAAIKGALDELRKTLGPSSKGLKFLMDHILWIVAGFMIVLVLTIITLIYNRREFKRPRVRVRVEDEESC